MVQPYSKRHSRTSRHLRKSTANEKIKKKQTNKQKGTLWDKKTKSKVSPKVASNILRRKEKILYLWSVI